MIKKNLNKNIENSNLSIAKNSQFDIRVIDIFTSGIVLNGNEIKSLRSKNVSIKEAYILCKNGELYIFNMYIAPYKNANANINENINCRLKRKLLMKKSEIRKIHKQSKEKGYIIYPIRIFINERGWAKLELSLAQKLRKYQIKINVKEKEIKRKIQKNDFF